MNTFTLNQSLLKTFLTFLAFVFALSFTSHAQFAVCGDDINHEGYNYSTVLIGEQCWFSDNCRYLPEVSPSSEGSETDPFFYVYGYEGTDLEAAMATANYETYGVLYNWPAVMTDGICPSGWHVPSDGEFTELTDFLGGEGVAGDAMKSTSGWAMEMNGSNSSGFNGLPGGYRAPLTGFNAREFNGAWWSTSESDSYPWHRILSMAGPVNRLNTNDRSYGFSARCLQDESVAEVPGCMDDASCNYNAEATEDDGSCLANDDCGVCGGAGIAEGECDCDGNVEDECGVCDGDGSSCCIFIENVTTGWYHSLGLKSDGTVVAWGGSQNIGDASMVYGESDVPSDLSNVISVSAGTYHSLALKSDGTVVAWGRNNNGQTDVPIDLLEVIAISGGEKHSLALKSDGTVVAWGTDSDEIPSDLSDVISIATSREHYLALKSDGTVVAWGNNDFNQSDVPNDLSNVIAIAAGDLHSLALKSDGTVVGWGIGVYGGTPPEDLTDVIAIEAGYRHSAALKSDGTVVAWGNNVFGGLDIPADLENVVSISSRYNHGLAIKSDGEVTGWGGNYQGQLDVPVFCDCFGNLDDCAGICGGTAIEDECGVCGGAGIADGDCDCDGNVEDECGVCGGSGIAEGACDCDGNVEDECGVCGGSGIADGECDCDGNIEDECGVCGGAGIADGECDCDGNVEDECGVCGGAGIAEGACDCDGNVEDECGVCGGAGIAEGACDCDGNVLDECGVCSGDNTSCSGCTDPSSCNYDPSAVFDDGSCANLVEATYGLDVDVVMEHTAGNLAGYTTYRLYVTTPHADDFLYAVYGDESEPLNISTSTSFYQDLNGALLGSSMNPALYVVFPELEYDSWVTIGLDQETVDGETAPLLSPSFPSAQFETGGNLNESGGNLELNDVIGSAWYIVNPDPLVSSNAYPDENQRILVAQLTTDGTISGAIWVQMYNHGQDTDVTMTELTFNGTTGTYSSSCGCTDMLSCSYDVSATIDDGSCVYIGADECDCAGNVLDDCGVCGGGNNDSCLDCADVANGTSTEDNCGVCDDDDTNNCVQDCAGVWGGDAILDDCGVCDGDSSSCHDCNGVPNGDAVAQWWIPNYSSTSTGSAILSCEQPNDDYQLAGSQDCALNIISTDTYCVDNTWDSICQSAYNCCIGLEPTCWDDEACNYNTEGCSDWFNQTEDGIFDGENGSWDNGTCEYPEEFYDCDGICIDPNACNYMEASNDDSIIFEAINTLYEEDFESYNVGDYIGEVSSEYWTTWSGTTGGSEDGQISDEQANSGNQSLKVYGIVSGGPMDVYLPMGLESTNDVSFNIYVPSGYSAYINVQEQQTAGIAWAFDIVFSATGAITLSIDQWDVAYGVYNLDSWNSIHFIMSPEEDIAEIIINGETLATIPFDDIIGGLNLFGYGDGITQGLYYIDDVNISEGVFVPNPNISSDNACTYPEEFYDCDGNCEGNMLDECGVCGGSGIAEGACDCDGNVLNECGECEEDDIYGCTYDFADNYDPSATADDGSCDFYGIQDDAYNDGWITGYIECEEGDIDEELDEAYDDGFADGYENGMNSVICPETSNCPSDLDGNGEVGTSDLLIFLGSYGVLCEVPGCMDETSCNYNFEATSDDGSCLANDECGVCGGDGSSCIEECEFGYTILYASDESGVGVSWMIDDENGNHVAEGLAGVYEELCLDPGACYILGVHGWSEGDGVIDFIEMDGPGLYDEWNEDEYAENVVNIHAPSFVTNFGPCLEDIYINHDCTEALEIECLNNGDIYMYMENGECVCMDNQPLGCMDEWACNYDPAVTFWNNQYCDYESCVDCGGAGINILNEFSFAEIYYGIDSYSSGDVYEYYIVLNADGNGYYWGIEETPDPFSNTFTFSLCSQEESILYSDSYGYTGTIDGGVITGMTTNDGGTFSYIPCDTAYEDGICDCDGNVLDECGVCGGDGSSCIEFSECGDDITFEDYDYSTVLIGEQCWFSENCRYLPEVSPSGEGSETDPFFYVYGYEGTDASAAMATANYETYGVLYNWPAVMANDGSLLCPSGWHIPSDEEFTELTDFLGGEGVAGGKMKEAGYDLWNSPNTGATNSSGWTGLPGGYRYSGGFSYFGGNGYWWSASESGSFSWARVLYNDNDDVSRYSGSRGSGFSARCVRD